MKATATQPDLIKRATVAMTCGNADAALAATRAGLSAFPNSVPVMEVHVAALDLAGRTDEALVLAVDCAGRRLRELIDTRQAMKEAPLGIEGRIFLSGYFYSGSGAVLDFLQDFQGTAKWSPAGEMRWIKFPGGLGDIHRRFRINKSLNHGDLVDFYLHIVGAKATPAPTGHYTQWRVVNKNSAKLIKSPQAGGYLMRCLECFLWLTRRTVSDQLTKTRIVLGFRRAVEEALDAAAVDMEVDRLLIDQAATAWRLGLTRFIPPSTFIVVHRDPRDQFVDASVALSAPGRRSLSPQEFAEQYRARRLAGERGMATIQEKFGHRVIALSFEDFVMDHDAVSRELLSQIGFDGRARIHHRYDVRKSRANVGKYEQALSDVDAETIAALLPEYLSPHVAARATLTPSPGR